VSRTGGRRSRPRKIEIVVVVAGLVLFVGFLALLFLDFVLRIG